MRSYQHQIKRALCGNIFGSNVEPRLVEAWMRLEHPTLDALSPADFNRLAAVASRCVYEAGLPESEALAISMGL